MLVLERERLGRDSERTMLDWGSYMVGLERREVDERNRMFDAGRF